MVNPHIGSDFDEFLREEGIDEEVTPASTVVGIYEPLERCKSLKSRSRVSEN